MLRISGDSDWLIGASAAKLDVAAEFEHGSLGETYLLSPSAASSSRGPETAAGCSTDGRPSTSTGDGAND